MLSDLVEKRQAGDLPFDRQPVRGASVEDIDLEFFASHYLPAAVAPDVLAANQRTTTERLAGLQLLAKTGEPTHGALLLVGRAPRTWAPGAYVQFVLYEGTDPSSTIIHQKELDGRIGDVVKNLEDLVQLNNRIRTEIAGAETERRFPDYPFTALQQLCRNAVLHRSYEVNGPAYVYWFSDRIEIHSPGGLYGRVREENFGAPGSTDYRNPTLAEGMKILGFVQRFGWGINAAREACAKNGNPPPMFEFSPSAVLATIKKVASTR